MSQVGSQAGSQAGSQVVSQVESQVSSGPKYQIRKGERDATARDIIYNWNSSAKTYIEYLTSIDSKEIATADQYKGLREDRRMGIPDQEPVKLDELGHLDELEELDQLDELC